MEEMSGEEISSILESELSLEEKSSILRSNNWPKDNKLTTSSPTELQKKVDEDIEAKIKKDDDHKLNDDEKPKRNDESLLHPSSQVKEVVDPLTDAEISVILDSDLISEEKSSLLTSNLPEDQIKVCRTPSRVELEANAKVALDLKLTSPNEKPLSLACNKNEENMTLSKVKTSTTSLGVELEGNNQHMRIEASRDHDPITHHENGSVNWIDEASSLRSQQPPAEDCSWLLDLKEHTVFIAREIKEPQNSSKGENVEKIYKEEAVCKKCCKYLFNEENVLKAKCKCKLALIHAHCAIQWAQEKGSICLSCGEQINNILVTLTMDTSTSSPQKNNIVEELEEPTFVSKKR